MKLVTAEQMREIDHLAMSQYQIPGLILMENAGRQVVEVIKQRLGKVAGRRVLVLAGRGNNGGDGLAAARHLYNLGAEVTVMITARPSEFAGDARVNLDILTRLPVKQLSLREEKDLTAARVALLATELVVDAIYGTGFRGTPPNLISRLFRLVNNSGKTVVSVDLPSGVEANTGRVAGEAIRAECTVTLALPKIGLVVEPGASYAGELVVADISIPRALIESLDLPGVCLDWQWCRERMPVRQVDGHKGDYGHVLVLGGSPGMTGAVALAGEAALRAGAGLVTVGVPESLNSILEQKLTEVMSRPLPQTASGRLDPGAISALKDLLPRITVVAVGPGLSQYPEAGEMMRQLLQRVSVPLVIDADGLNVLAQEPELLKEVKVPLVLTPHPGEMSRLLKTTVKEIQNDRLEAARSGASRLGAIVVLKGARTLVALPDGGMYVNPTGNPGLASGGTGDVLTGIIAGLIAQGISPVEAAGVGVFVHGLAGDRARERLGMRGMAATDVIAHLPAVLKEMEEGMGERR
ncbi:MAG: NAD(P)H-hydrate dehydratase [Syntrophomonadaceae bacterium]|nr:NAD(P)H-hydrate dehydratase [Syntrophomonadaceae bacterium]